MMHGGGCKSTHSHSLWCCPYSFHWLVASLVPGLLTSTVSAVAIHRCSALVVQAMEPLAQYAGIEIAVARSGMSGVRPWSTAVLATVLYGCTGMFFRHTLSDSVHIICLYV